MDFVQQRGNFLDLVNHYQSISLAAKAFAKQRRPGGILAEDVRLQEIYNARSFAVLSNPIALPDAPRPPKKSRLPRRQPQVQETPGYCAHAGKIIMIIMTSRSSALAVRKRDEFYREQSRLEDREALHAACKAGSDRKSEFWMAPDFDAPLDAFKHPGPGGPRQATRKRSEHYTISSKSLFFVAQRTNSSRLDTPNLAKMAVRWFFTV